LEEVLRGFLQQSAPSRFGNPADIHARDYEVDAGVSLNFRKAEDDAFVAWQVLSRNGKSPAEGFMWVA
jgi:hypothetical protein